MAGKGTGGRRGNKRTRAGSGPGDAGKALISGRYCVLARVSAVVPRSGPVLVSQQRLLDAQQALP